VQAWEAQIEFPGWCGSRAGKNPLKSHEFAQYMKNNDKHFPSH
jgi:hypothetical protein